MRLPKSLVAMVLMCRYLFCYACLNADSASNSYPVGTRAMIEDMSYERDFPIDLWLCYYHVFVGLLNGWPSGYALLKYIGKAEDEKKDILTPEDLSSARGEDGKELFPRESLKSFFAAYEKPCKIVVPDSGEDDSKHNELRDLLEQMQAQMRRMEMQLAQK